MSYETRSTLFIFLDESGNFDFSPNGSSHFSLTALCTLHPVEGRDAFYDLHYTLADNGVGQECFHATEDYQTLRDKVFALITGLEKDFDIYFATAEKRKVLPSMYPAKHASEFFIYMCKRLLQYVITRERYSHAKRVVIVFSSIFNKTWQGGIQGALKSHLKDHTELPFSIYFRGTKFDMNCQIADYCSWAINIKWVRSEMRSYELIKDKIAGEESFFGSDGPDYY
jgi:hypothetical protein